MVTSIPTLTAGRLTRPDGAVIQYETGGEGKAVVFAHGLGGNHLSWWQSAPVFAATHRVVSFSHRGFAPSTAPDGAPDPRDYAGDLIALLDHLGIDKTIIVGQSMGGWTCVETMLAAPERVAGLVMACTTGSFDYDGFGDAQVKAWREAMPAKLADFAARGIHRAAGERMAEMFPALHGLYQGIDRLTYALDKDEVGKRIRAMRTRGAADAARMTCPALFVIGTEDPLICPRGIELVAASWPQAKTHLVAGAGHSVYFECGNLFNEIVYEFLDGIGWD
jgi:3-oxoadipate enol-lactonase